HARASRAPAPGARPAPVVVDNGRIVEILDGRRTPAVSGATVIDLGGLHLLPGLWGVHWPFGGPRLPDASIAELTLQYAANAYEALTEAGVTAVRTAGTPHLIGVALRRAFDAGRLVGP